MIRSLADPSIKESSRSECVQTLTPPQTTQGKRVTRFLAVIVLHRLMPQDSLSYQTLLASAEYFNPVQSQLNLLLIDNCPTVPLPYALPSWVRYEKAPRNLGLAAAYNRAIDLALTEGFDWMITLDQDSDLPESFLARVAEIAESLRSTIKVAAIVPQLIGDGKTLSPLCFRLGAFPAWYPIGFTGIPSDKVFAFNSGSVMRVSALRQAGGYDPRFWLDYSDTRLFCQLAKHGKQVMVAGDLQLSHNFSMLDKQRRMLPERYRELLSTETALWDMEMNRLAGLERTIRLVGRYVKHLLNKDQQEFRRETSRALFVRLFRSRKWRRHDWQQQLVRRFPEMRIDDQAPSRGFRPKVSVCMATYNGEKYLAQQLQSILIQLSNYDEVIIVDDASADGTVDIVSNFNDSRLILIQHAANQGVVASFEDAVRNATGDVLFLSDQDDIWAPNRVSRTLEAFADNKELALVVTNVALINEDGTCFATDKRLKRWPFDSRLIPNLIANRFQGSAMAFRSSLTQKILPFPGNFLFLHDAWIGARCALTRTGVGYISEPLLFYRRHAENLSEILPAWLMVRKRVELISSLFFYSVLHPFHR
jgi:glycosyltransferase involved in cell wall biosynthesis